MKKVFCDAYCGWEATGYKINDVDLSDVLKNGVYVLGDNITDKNNEGALKPEYLVNDYTLIVSGSERSKKQLMIEGTVFFFRRIYLNENNEISSVEEWIMHDIESVNWNLESMKKHIISENEPAYIDGAIWIKPIG